MDANKLIMDTIQKIIEEQPIEPMDFNDNAKESLEASKTLGQITGEKVLNITKKAKEALDKPGVFGYGVHNIEKENAINADNIAKAIKHGEAIGRAAGEQETPVGHIIRATKQIGKNIEDRPGLVTALAAGMGALALRKKLKDIAQNKEKQNN